MIKENFIQFIESSIKNNWNIEAFSDYKGDSYKYADVADNIFETLKEKEMSGLKTMFSVNDFSVLSTCGDENSGKKLAEIDKIYTEKYHEGLTPEKFSLDEVPNSELAVISYTSGTTGFSKGVMLSHNSIVSNVVYAHNNMPLEPGDEIVSFLPLAHSYGCAFEFLFPFSIGYGMTECGPLISYAGWDKTRLGSAGKVVDGMEVRIDSADPYNEVGEIIVRGENVMLGYYKNEKTTSEVIDKDGWLHTGDLGVIDSENFIYIRGRSKSMLLGPSGQNIYPEEIEAKLNNLLYILESVVIDSNGRLIALVYPDYETAKNDGIEEVRLEAIIENHRKNINKELPVYMNLSKIRIYPEEFEKTPKKSIKRFLYTDEG